MELHSKEVDVKMQEVAVAHEQNQIQVTMLQNQMMQHQQAIALQMKEFKCKLHQSKDSKK